MTRSENGGHRALPHAPSSWSFASRSDRADEPGSFRTPCPATVRRKPVGGANQFLADLRIGGMTGIVHDHELGAWPQPVQLPRIGDRRLKVEASVYQYARNLRQRVRSPQQAAIVQPRVVPPARPRAACSGHSRADRTARRDTQPDRTVCDATPNSRNRGRRAPPAPACRADCRTSPSRRGCRRLPPASRAHTVRYADTTRSRYPTEDAGLHRRTVPWVRAAGAATTGDRLTLAAVPVDEHFPVDQKIFMSILRCTRKYS